ncbi:hypothetical protein V6N11_010576 [Hibiscus sabdariffa]|uniref:RNase H type-1 domain-containing protein n=1 Tax=Hibiscus sabdariffa TaxID=183260 RepID=A0ABR2S6A2_9ROSI
MIVYYQWKLPAQGWPCLNADATVSSVDDLGTIGGVLRDSSGAWLRGYGKCVGKVSTIQAELWSICVGLQLACSLKFHSFFTSQTLVFGFPMDTARNEHGG